MAKIGFVGFGEVNTPVEVIIRKCKAAEEALQKEFYKVAERIYKEEAAKAQAEQQQHQGTDNASQGGDTKFTDADYKDVE